ncbi:MAG: class I SAM-dependent methyltransferase [Nanoarchaeota archaeon]|nr:class I SAM-dependent methyltransferase [Nanoarchaeota archaeon]
MNVFNELSGDDYRERFQEPEQQFYAAITSQLACYPVKSTILDIGTGPGTIAELANAAGLELDILGIEPSNLVDDAAELAKQEGKVLYTPKKGDMMQAPTAFELTLGSLHGLTLLRSAHEIAKSMGGKTAFYNGLGNLLQYSAIGGQVIIADPCYAPHIRVDIEGNQEIIRATREILDELINHSDPPENLFSPRELIMAMGDLGCEIAYIQSIPAQNIPPLLEQKYGITVSRSPKEFFVARFEKVTEGALA